MKLFCALIAVLACLKTFYSKALLGKLLYNTESERLTRKFTTYVSEYKQLKAKGAMLDVKFSIDVETRNRYKKLRSCLL